MYDLASLQKEANLRMGLTAGQTASVLQRLYEGGYISYPRTSCRHIREDMLERMPALLSLLKDDPCFRSSCGSSGRQGAIHPCSR